MTKKHFVAISAALKAAKPVKPESGLIGVDYGAALATWLLLVDAIEGVSAAANPNFDRARFALACGAV